jgi:nicotinamide-nucleotide amidase
MIALLPGVPAELRAMFDQELADRLRPRLAGSAPASLRLRTTQVAESALVERVRLADPDHADLDLAWCVGRWGVDLVLRGDDRRRLEERARALREALGDCVFAEGDVELPSVVLETCRARGHRVAVAESCTAGLVGGALTSAPGSSEIFAGGVIAYDDRIKELELGVDPDLLLRHGAVSPEVASAMADGARERFGCDRAVSTTGIAGPGGGSDGKPVGTVCIALSTGNGPARARTIRLGGDRELVRRWTVAVALDTLRRDDVERP